MPYQLTPEQVREDRELRAKIRTDLKSRALSEAIFALNAVVAQFRVDGPEADTRLLLRLRDEAWDLGVQSFGWKD